MKSRIKLSSQEGNMQKQVMFSHGKGNIRKTLVIVIGVIIYISACKPPQLTNAPTIPDTYFRFSKSKHQTLSILDSIIGNSQFFFKEETEEPDHMLLNLKDRSDTITFVLILKDRDLHNRIESNDSSILFVMNVGKYVNKKMDETPLYPKIDSLQKIAYLNKLDSFIIKPLRQQLNKSQ